MWWALISILFILILAIFLRKATRGTPFAHKAGCTPYIEHLRGMEQDSKPEHKQENLW